MCSPASSHLLPESLSCSSFCDVPSSQTQLLGASWEAGGGQARPAQGVQQARRPVSLCLPLSLEETRFRHHITPNLRTQAGIGLSGFQSRRPPDPSRTPFVLGFIPGPSSGQVCQRAAFKVRKQRRVGKVRCEFSAGEERVRG